MNIFKVDAEGGGSLTHQDDVICWGLIASRIYTTGSLYRFMASGGVDNRMMRRIWKCKIPLKIKIFL
jgi:hypothetical protein